LHTIDSEDSSGVRTLARAAVLFSDSEHQLRQKNDRMFTLVMVLQWLGGIAAALWISPRAWAGVTSSIHIHVWAAALLGGIIVAFPIILALAQPGRALTRHTIAIAQMLDAALLIHLTGGRIESHFQLFGLLAFLALYLDWRVMATATAVVATEHLIRGLLWPQSVYGILTPSLWRWVEHAGWILFENTFLLIAIARTRKEMFSMAQRSAQLESANTSVERKIAERTVQLTTEITARKQQEEALARACDAARGAALAKAEFLANMSHEIRTPMTAVIGYADLLLDSQTTESERIKHVQTIRRNGEHLLRLINDILDISKIEAGQMTAETVACSPSGLIVEVVSLMRVRAKEKNLDFEVEYQTPIPKTIKSDPMRLRQIIMNLVGNAIKFTAKGQVRVILRCDGVDADRPRLSIEIADTGIGLTREQLAKLFQPFVQADSSMTRRFGGSGLGLAICHRLAELLGGEITVESLIGRGSSFTLTVDTGSLTGVRMIEGLREACVAEAEEPVSDGPQLAQRLACSVLLAEDGLDNQLLISTVLRNAGAEVTIAENGRIAVEKVSAAVELESPFDVILMDMQMPELDGYGATAKLRQRGYQGAIVALTAHAMADDQARCLTAGCTDYLTKPIDRVRLIATVARYAEQTRADRAKQDSCAEAPAAPAPLVSEFAADVEMAEIIAAFVASMPARSTALREALDAGQIETVMRAAHQLKGAAGGFGFGSITDSAARLEQACQQRGNAMELQAYVAELAELCGRVSTPRSSSTRGGL